MEPLRSTIDTQRTLAEFIRHCREQLTGPGDRADFDWDASVWPSARWAKVTVGKRRQFTDGERLDAAFIDFAKAYFIWKRVERGGKTAWELQGLKCLESALVTMTGSGSLRGLSWAVLDEAAGVARNYFAKQTRYHVGRTLREIARFVTKQHLVEVDLSNWKSPLARPSSTSRTGEEGRAESARKLPSQAGLDAMAEIFANDVVDPQARFISAVWALLMSAPWRISEVLRLHVDAEFEEPDDDGVVSYGLRYYGAKGFEYDIKWVPKVMEPVAREAFRRIRVMTGSARALAHHLEAEPEVPFRHPDAPQVDVDGKLTLEEKSKYLRRPMPKATSQYSPAWRFQSMREHWDGARADLPRNFPYFNQRTRLKWSKALFCIHEHFLHETRPTNWYGLARPTSNTVNDLLRPSGEKTGVPWKLGYREVDGSCLRLTTHQPRHLVSTAAARGSMTDEDLAKWAGRAMLRDNRVYNHVSEEERVACSRKVLEGAGLVGRSTVPQVKAPTSRAEFNLRATGPTHRTPFGACEHDWAMSPCTKHLDCVVCAEHAYVKGDSDAHARLRATCEVHLTECEKALAAIKAGMGVADRWLEHALKWLMRGLSVLTLLESKDIEEGTNIRLTDGGAEHSHLRRALEQRLPQLRDPSVPAGIKALIGRYLDGEALIEAARRDDRGNTGRVANRQQAHLEGASKAGRHANGNCDDETDARAPREGQARIPDAQSGPA